MNLYLLATLMLATEPGTGNETKRFQFSQPKMGTTCQLVLYASNDQQARQAAQKAFARIDALNRIMSDYDPESELRQICVRAVGTPVRVTPELYFVLEKASRVSELSEGAFDVTVGPVVKLWRRSRKNILLPDPTELKLALQLVDYRNVVLANGTVMLKKPGMLLDLGGIAKGYAADEALKILRQEKINRALVAMGGDIALGDAPPEKEGWKVGIAPIFEEGNKAGKFMILANQAVSTSGDTEQYVEIDGVRYSHLVNPKTGIGLTRRISVSVVARHGIDSDSLTKVVSILGPEKGNALIEKFPSASARVVLKTDAGVKVTTSRGFPKVIEKEEK